MSHRLQPLARGVVRLRLPHRSDGAGVAALCRRIGLDVDLIDATRLLRFDPRARAVACAVCWNGDGEHVVGMGATDREAGAGPDLVLADPAHPGVPALLEHWLAEQPAARARRVA